MKLFITIAVIVLIGALSAFFIINNPKDIEKPSLEQSQDLLGINPAIKTLTFKDYNGSDVKLSDFSGTPLVVNSWAAWCPFCKKELVDFALVQKEIGDKAKIIAVNRRESLDVAKSYTDELGVSDDLLFLLDPDDVFYHAIDAFAMPETIFVTRQGRILDRFRGPLSADVLREKINNLLN